MRRLIDIVLFISKRDSTTGATATKMRFGIGVLKNVGGNYRQQQHVGGIFSSVAAWLVRSMDRTCRASQDAPVPTYRYANLHALSTTFDSVAAGTSTSYVGI